MNRDAKDSYELRLPIPSGPNMKALKEACQELYQKDLEFIILRGIKALATDVDDRAKKILFALNEKDGTYGGYSGQNHLDAQALVDGWKPTERKVGKGNFDAVVNRLKKMGILASDAEPANLDELEEMVGAAIKSD
jgi:hypothetical protein